MPIDDEFARFRVTAIVCSVLCCEPFVVELGCSSSPRSTSRPPASDRCLSVT
jgi:hypothetical protein